MNLKKNLFLVVWGAVIVVLLGACGFLLFRQRSAFVEAKGELESAEQSLQTLNTRNPFPSRENVSITETNLTVLDHLFDDFMTHLSANQIAEEPMQGAQFLTVLEKTLARLTDDAVVHEVMVPQQFAYGFDAYALGSIPATQDVPRLTVQLQMVEALSQLLFTNGVTSVSSISRPVFDATGDASAGGGMMGGFGGEDMFMGGMFPDMPDAGADPAAGALVEESHLYSIEHFTLTFSALGPSIMQVLESLAGPGLFAVVTDLSAGVGTGAGSAAPSFGPPGGFDTMSMGRPGGEMMSMEEMSMMGGPGGGGFRGFGPGGGFAGPGGAYGGLEESMMMTRPGSRPGATTSTERRQRYLLREDRQVAGKEILQVTMGVDVYRFKRADEEEDELDAFLEDEWMGMPGTLPGSDVDPDGGVAAPAAVEETEL